MRNVLDKSCRENEVTHFVFSKYFWKVCRLWDYVENISALAKDRYTFLIISHSVLLRMKNVSDKSCREIQITHFVFSILDSKIVPFMR
jgi:hypothetical protein